MDCYDVPDMELATTESVLKTLGSGVGLDVAKKHTGICLYSGGKITYTGFRIEEYDSSDVHAEYNMRKEFKAKLSDILNGLSLNHCIIEDVYGGQNFDTVRKLLALNTVIDELIDEGVVTVGQFYRWSETRWMKYFRLLFKSRGGLKSKIETQRILEYLQDSFYLTNCDSSEREKREIFFEDICDATGMLCSVAMYLKEMENGGYVRQLTMRDIKLFYIDYYCDDDFTVQDSRVMDEDWHRVEPKFRNLEQKVLSEATQHPDKVLAMYLPVEKLGIFGLTYKLKFYESGVGVLIWYVK